MGTQIIGFHENISVIPGITLEAISKKPFGPISALGAYINSSKYLVYYSGLIFAANLLVRLSLKSVDGTLNQNPYFR